MAWLGQRIAWNTDHADRCGIDDPGRFQNGRGRKCHCRRGCRIPGNPLPSHAINAKPLGHQRDLHTAGHRDHQVGPRATSPGDGWRRHVRSPGRRDVQTIHRHSCRYSTFATTLPPPLRIVRSSCKRTSTGREQVHENVDRHRFVEWHTEREAGCRSPRRSSTGSRFFKNNLITFNGTPSEVSSRVEQLGLDIVTLQPFRDLEGPYKSSARVRSLGTQVRYMEELGCNLLMICSNVAADSLGGIDRAALTCASSANGEQAGLEDCLRGAGMGPPHRRLSRCLGSRAAGGPSSGRLGT